MDLYKSDWKSFTLRIWSVMRLLFISTIVWQFFLTISVSSTWGIVLFSSASLLSSFLIILWIISILGLLLSFLLTLGEDHAYDSPVAYVFLVLTILLYIFLLIITIVSNIPGWGPAVNYFVIIVWSVFMIYFKRQLTIMIVKDDMSTEE